MSKKILGKFFPFSRHVFVSLSFLSATRRFEENYFSEETSDEFLPGCDNRCAPRVTGFFKDSSRNTIFT